MSESPKIPHIVAGILFMLLVSSAFIFIDGAIAPNYEERFAKIEENGAELISGLLTASANQTREEGSKQDIETSEARVGYLLQGEDRLRESIRAKAWLVGDLDTGEIILEENSSAQYPIASISKYITAITSLELLDQGETTAITREILQTNGAREGFTLGDEVKIGTLLYPLLIVSGNDAAEALAQHKNRDVFLTHMKSKVESYGLLNTNFADPSGLSEDNYSTARDLFKLMRVAQENYPEIIEISRLRSFEVDDYKWVNINKAQDFDGFQGGKTGFTNAAQQTSIGYYKIKTANEQEKNIGIVILQSTNRELDSLNILNYIDKFVSYI